MPIDAIILGFEFMQIVIIGAGYAPRAPEWMQKRQRLGLVWRYLATDLHSMCGMMQRRG